MKNIKCLFYSIIIILFIMLISVNAPVYATEEDVYDVILFWGQSNMTGYAGKYEIERTDDKQAEINKIGIDKYSKITGIRKEILENTVSTAYTKVEQIPGTAFEYIYSEDGGSLQELNADTKRLGQYLTYNPTTGLLEVYNKEKHDGKYSLQKSAGTNMIPQFCKQYYKRTHRKVVAVMCANGGEKIANFLPANDKNYGDSNKQYIYEAMVAKYKSAIAYLEENGYKIGNKYYVVSQGGSDAMQTTWNEYDYVEIFEKVHNNIKKDLGITKGAMVYSGITIGKKGFYAPLIKLYKQQKAVVARNDDIIAGSNFIAKNYIPDKNSYNNSTYLNKKYVYTDGTKMTYEDAFKVASYSLCSSNNLIHMNGAGLSQVGYEVANAFTKVEKIEIKSMPNKTKYIVGSTLDTEGLVIQVTFANGAVRQGSKGFKCTPTKLEKVGTQEITVTYGGKEAKFNVNVKDKTESTKRTKYTKTLNVGDILELKTGHSWWTFKSYKDQEIETAEEYKIMSGTIRLQILKIDGGWLKLKVINPGDSINNRINFKVGNVLYIYYGSTASKSFSILK